MIYLDASGHAPLCTRLDYDGDGSEPCSRCGSKLWHHPLPDPIHGATCERVVRGEWRLCGAPACAQVTPLGLSTRAYCWDCAVRLSLYRMTRRDARANAPLAFFPALGRVVLLAERGL